MICCSFRKIHILQSVFKGVRIPKFNI